MQIRESEIVKRVSESPEWRENKLGTPVSLWPKLLAELVAKEIRKEIDRGNTIGMGA